MYIFVLSANSKDIYYSYLPVQTNRIIGKKNYV